MARSRSKSLVQSIASDVPEFHEQKENGGLEILEETPDLKPRLTRSKSIPLLNKPIRQVSLLDPFNQDDFDRIWLQHINSDYPSGSIEYEFEKTNRKAQLSQMEVQNFMRILNVNLQQFNYFQQDLSSLKYQLDEIKDNYQNINSKTQDFNSRTHSLITQEEQLKKKIESIDSILKNFENLEDITKKLSTPNNIKLIRSKGFRKISDNLNESLEFLNSTEKGSQIKFKNIEIYKIKFRQCMTRCLTLIKDYLNNELRKLESGVNLNAEFRSISVYKEFENYVDELADEYYSFPNLIDIFITRIEEKHELEYKGLLLEVLNNYFNIRLNLVNFESDLAKFNSPDLVKFTQDNISYISKLVGREFKLFKRMFAFTDKPIPPFINTIVYDFFKSLVEPFYDSVRQRILKENSISVLCQLTNLLQNYYEFEEDEFPDRAAEEINLGAVFEPVLNDSQSRLIFRIQIYMDNKLIPYKPNPNDLKIAHGKVTKSELDEELPENLFEDLYLPLGKALTILSNIYELINSVVFDDLAHYIVHGCIEILKKASALALRYSGLIESKLYYLKNLIILKYQLNNFDIQFVRTETSLDFTSGLNELYNMIKNGEIMVNLNQNGWFNLIKKTVPKVINNMMDAKLEVEYEINMSINELLLDYLNQLIDPLTKESKSTDEVLKASEEFKRNIHDFTPRFKSQITLYINDYNILRILFNNLIELLITYYEGYYASLKNTEVDLNEIMEPEIFNKFFNNVVDGLLDDESLLNNLMDIKPLLKFDDELSGSTSPKNGDRESDSDADISEHNQSIDGPIGNSSELD